MMKDDLLTWLVHAAPMNERSSSAIARRYLTVIFAALFTTVQILTHTLYHIAANPEYADRLREEARSVTKEFGWSYDAIQSLPSFDSILRETGRYTGIAYGTSILPFPFLTLHKSLQLASRGKP